MKVRNLFMSLVATMFLSSCDLSDISSVLDSAKDAIMFWKKDEEVHEEQPKGNDEGKEPEQVDPNHVTSLEEKRVLFNKFYESATLTNSQINFSCGLSIDGKPVYNLYRTDSRVLATLMGFSDDGTITPVFYSEVFEENFYGYIYNQEAKVLVYDETCDDNSLFYGLIENITSVRSTDDEIDQFDVYLDGENKFITYASLNEEDREFYIQFYPEYSEQISSLLDSLPYGVKTEITFNGRYLDKIESKYFSGFNFSDEGTISIVFKTQTLVYYDIGTTQIDRPEGVVIPPQTIEDDTKLSDAEKESFFRSFFEASERSVNYQNYVAYYSENDVLRVKTEKYGSKKLNFNYDMIPEGFSSSPSEYIEIVDGKESQYQYSFDNESWSSFDGYIQLATAPITYPGSFEETLGGYISQMDLYKKEDSNSYLVKQSSKSVKNSLISSFPELESDIISQFEGHDILETVIVLNGDKIEALTSDIINVEPIFGETGILGITVVFGQYRLEMDYDSCDPIVKPEGIDAPLVPVDPDKERVLQIFKNTFSCNSITYTASMNDLYRGICKIEEGKLYEHVTNEDGEYTIYAETIDGVFYMFQKEDDGSFERMNISSNPFVINNLYDEFASYLDDDDTEIQYYEDRVIIYGNDNSSLDNLLEKYPDREAEINQLAEGKELREYIEITFTEDRQYVDTFKESFAPYFRAVINGDEISFEVEETVAIAVFSDLNSTVVTRPEGIEELLPSADPDRDRVIAIIENTFLKNNASYDLYDDGEFRYSFQFDNERILSVTASGLVYVEYYEGLYYFFTKNENEDEYIYVDNDDNFAFGLQSAYESLIAILSNEDSKKVYLEDKVIIYLAEENTSLNNLLKEYPKHQEEILSFVGDKDVRTYMEIDFSEDRQYIVSVKEVGFIFSASENDDTFKIAVRKYEELANFYNIGTTSVTRPEGIEVPPQV